MKSRILLKGLVAFMTTFLLNYSSLSAQCLDQTLVGDCYFNATTGTSESVVAIYLNGVSGAIDVSSDNPTIGDQTINSTGHCTDEVLTFSIPADGGSYTIDLSVSGCSESINVSIPAACAPNAACDASNEIGGLAYRDLNGNGIQETAEFRGVETVFVEIFGADGSVYSATTASDGSYAIAVPPAAYPVRVEYSGFPNGMVSAPILLNEILTAGTCSANVGLYFPNDFCEGDPDYATSCYIAGDPLPNGIVGDSDALITFNSQTEGPLSGPSGPPISHDIIARDIGTVYGLAFNSGSQQLFMSSVLKRHAGLGSIGLGGIYVADYTQSPPVSTPFLDLAAIPGIDVGSIPLNPDRGLTNLPLDPNRDEEAWTKILREGLGDMDISADGNTLYVTNLFEANFIEIDITNYNATGAIPTAADVSTISGPPNPCTSTSRFRPFALKQSEGKLFAGYVCSGENGGTAADLAGYIYSYDLATGTWTEELEIPLCYERDIDELDFNPWSDDISTFTVISQNDVLQRRTIKHPQPFIADIEIGADGSLIVAVGDRTGLQIGRVNFGPDPSDPYAYTVFNGGDILKAQRYDNFFLLENGGMAGPFNNSACLFGQDGGPGGGEFYCDEPFLENDVTVGGLAINLANDEVLSTGYDPFAFQSGGVIWYDNTNGAIAQRLELYNAASGVGNFGKGTGLGDLEALCSPPPTYVGNLVFDDQDEDGVRDPNEPGFANLDLALVDSNGNTIATTTTDADGFYSFTDADGLMAFESYTIIVTDSALDSTTGVLTIGGDQYQITDTDVGEGTNPDLNDSDAVRVNGVPTISFTVDGMGFTNTSLDFGFAQGVFDLALNVTAPAGPFAPGDDVPFTINVFNQGTDAAQDIEVSTIIGPDFTFDPALNPGFTLNMGVVTAVFPGPIIAGTDDSFTLILTVDPNATAATAEIFAEISAADDDSNPNNAPPVDIDSVSDTNPNNDNYDPADDNVIDNTNGDEDDSDGEEVSLFLPIFDLALEKTVASTNPTPGGQVTYDIVVTNEGNVDAFNVEVTDFIPTGLSYASSNNANGWAFSGGNAVITIAGPIAAGADETVSLVLNIDAGFQGTSIVNQAEISAADDDTDSNNTPPGDIDSFADSDPDNDTFTDPLTGNDLTEDDSDDATINFDQEFDLALTLTSNATSLNPGADITYTITIFNQGTLDATNVDVITYLPADLILNTTIASNSIWNMVGDNIITSVAGPIPPGGFETVDLVVTLDPAFAGTSVTAEAEIFGAEDANGTADDVDSTPDQILGNDTNGGNDVIDNSNGDEDDHDAETIGVDLFDLALQKEMAAGQAGPFTAGSPITFTLTVSNEGDIAADNISLVDFFGTDLVLNDADWTDQGDNTATITLSVANGGLAAPLQAGDSASVDITFNISNTASGSLTNSAEITGATDENGDPVNDIDSVFDDNPNNDGPGEDDNDSVTVTLEAFDLALDKSLAAGQTGPFAPGGPLTYTLTVTNEGGVAADNIDLVDFYAPDLVLNDADWTDEGNGTATITLSVANGGLPAPLAPGATASVDITFTIATDVTGSITNAAEITDATDENGNPVNDIDSTFDDDPNNDAPGEDDNDSITTSLSDFDLALDKSLAAGQTGPFSAGAPITFTITVMNEGGIAADNISLVDYFGTDLILNDAAWADQGDNTATIDLSVANGGLAAPLAPGGTASVDITFTIAASASGSLTNAAEITDATDEFGNPVTDIDSIYDNDPTNDPASDDDNDSVTVTLEAFDLALAKTLAAGQTGPFAPGLPITYTLTVTNEGGVAADNIGLVDFFNSSLILNDADWVDQGDNTATITLSVANGGLASALAPGQTASVDITFTISTTATGSLMNAAEITGATDQDGNPVTDIDSVFDNDPNNDGPNEDDNDSITTPLASFDLALDKSVAAGQAATFSPGDAIVYTITVSNEGGIAADNIEVTDFFGVGHLLDDAAWTDLGNNTAVITLSVANGGLAAPLAPGASVGVDIRLIIQEPSGNGTSVSNGAEISNATDSDGNTVPDIDSVFDNDPNNDGPGEDDNDRVTVPLELGCNDVFDCPPMDACTTPLTPVTVCPESCNFAPGFTFVSANTLFNCSVSADVNNCLVYTPLPGMEGIGSDEIYAVFQDVDGCLHNLTINMTIGHCGCVNPLVEECIAPFTDFGDFGTFSDCPTFCALNGLNYHIVDISSSHDCNLELSADGQCFEYQALPGFTGVDIVTAIACTQTNFCDTVTYEITVGNCNGNPPVANSDAFMVGMAPINLPVLNNDFDPDGDPLSICNFTQPSSGTVVSNGSSFDYTPVDGFVGQITFEYTICDALGNEDSTTVTLIIDAGCDNPVECVAQMTELIVCPEFCGLSGNITITHQSSLFDCSVTNLNNECIRYLSLPAFLGTDEVTVTGCDDQGNCQDIVLSITVGDCNGPVAPPTPPTPPVNPPGPPVTPPVTPPAPPVTPPAPPAPPTCGPYDLCIPQIVEMEVCPQFCNLGADYSLSVVTSSHDCQAEIVNAQCFDYLSLPLFVGLDEVSATACDGAGNCETVILNITVDPNGCGAIVPQVADDEIEEKDNCDLELPNGFSPNGDGVNEEFKLIAVDDCSLYNDFTFRVFKSTGKLVYEQADADLDRILWDGTYKNTESVEGTYFYVLEYEFNAQPVRRTGFIELKR